MATLQYYYAEYAALPKLGRASRGSQNIKAEKKLLLPGPNNRIRKGGNNLRRRGTLYTTHTEKNLLDFTVYIQRRRDIKIEEGDEVLFYIFYFSLFLAASGQSVAKFYFHTAAEPSNPRHEDGC